MPNKTYMHVSRAEIHGPNDRIPCISADRGGLRGTFKLNSQLPGAFRTSHQRGSEVGLRTRYNV
ncbi:hypothetical protein FKW77_000246 [Venturia effusa]|uniref:Uncharacterized protein n=1 Tax=Venturia effusa TaxID=50376 RepID=A0A517LKR1_9PEZI|nr:hypothetical protein FKW77_000246 [Venturia effusa]